MVAGRRSLHASQRVGRQPRGRLGWQPMLLHRRAGKLSRGSHGAVAGRSQATLRRVAGPTSSGVGTALPAGFAKLASVLHAASFRRGRRAFVDAGANQATRRRSFRRLPEPLSTRARRARRAVPPAKRSFKAATAPRATRRVLTAQIKTCARARGARRSPRTRPSNAASGALSEPRGGADNAGATMMMKTSTTKRSRDACSASTTTRREAAAARERRGGPSRRRRKQYSSRRASRARPLPEGRK